ncbi:MAG: hypothetical protein AAFY55_18980, partial [Bacteroidota bacterium]
ASTSALFDLLQSVTNENAKGEYYLTDVVGLAAEAGGNNLVVVCDEADVLGVNSRAQLADANAAFQDRIRAEFMGNGVTLVASDTVFFSHDTKIGRDSIIEPNVVFGPGVDVAQEVHIKAFSHELCAYTILKGGIGICQLGPGIDAEHIGFIANHDKVITTCFGRQTYNICQIVFALGVLVRHRLEEVEQRAGGR